MQPEMQMIGKQNSNSVVTASASSRKRRSWKWYNAAADDWDGACGGKRDHLALCR